MSGRLEEVSGAQLGEAIDKLDLQTLRKVVKEMCASSKECHQEAVLRLIIREAARPSQKRATDGSAGTRLGNKKQKREGPRVWAKYEKCTTCGETFDVITNKVTSCKSHDGKSAPIHGLECLLNEPPDILELDPDAFPDDDQVELDPHSIDVMTDWRRKNCPEGFVWRCCDQDCNAEGCVVQKHIAEKKDSFLLDVYGDN